jgi:hypothetical protein
MKITTLDAYDRYKHFTSQSFDISECCQNLIDQRPFGENSFYIFAHTRTDDDGISKRLIWQPRLTKPKSQTNSMLFKWICGTDNIRICWLIPAREMWTQYKKGNVTGHDLTLWSIDQFENHRIELEAPEPDDLSDAQINQIYRDVCNEARRKKRQEATRLKILEASSS